MNTLETSRVTGPMRGLMAPRVVTCAMTILATTAVALAVGACGRTPPEPAVVSLPLEPETSTSRAFGDYVLHFNAIRTDRLTPEIARTYNITRSANRALLNVSMLKNVEGRPGEPVAGKVSVTAVNLNGQFKDLTVREIREGQAVYYIGDVPVTNDETLVFSVDATPANETSSFSVRFKREFFGG